MKVMVIDDEELARYRLCQLLGSFDDLEVVGEAEDGDQGLKAISEFRPDVVFLDIEMPGLNGMEVAASLPVPRPRIIFCTAYDEYAVDAFEQYPVDYLVKPVRRARLASAIERLRTMIEEQNAQRDLSMAGEVQKRLFPQAPAKLTSLEYAGICRPARTIGGDYYDFLPIAADTVGFIVADVSGKGTPAALLMASLQGRLQSQASLYGGRVAALTDEINRSIASTTAESKYATLFYGVYDDRTRRLSYVNAGHVPPVLIRTKGTGPGAARPTIERLRTGGLPAGLFKEANYSQETIKLEPGDILLIVTDGITETSNPEEEEFGEARLIDLVCRNARLSAPEICDLIVAEASRFRSGASGADDATLVVAKAVSERT